MAKQTVGAPPQDSKSTYLRLIAKQQMRPGEDSPLSKISDQPRNSAATSHKKFREAERVLMKTTPRPQKGLATSERNNHPCKPSFAIKSDKETLLTQRVTTSQRNTQEKQMFEAPHTHQAQRRGTQRKGAGPNLVGGGTAPGTNTGRRVQRQPEAGDPARRPGTKPTRRRQSLCYDRGLRKNTVPT